MTRTAIITGAAQGIGRGIAERLARDGLSVTLADLPANTQFLSPRLYLNTGATAAAVAYDCAGLYLETDY